MQSFGLGQQQNCHGSAAPVSSLSEFPAASALLYCIVRDIC